jgi:hypothetical protein
MGVLGRVGLAVVLALPAALAGCSPLASVPPPKTPLDSFQQCSTSRFPPIADAVLAANTAGLAVIFLSGATIEYAHNQSATVPSWDQKPLTVGAGWIVGSVVSTAATVALIESARYGVKSARDCQAARDELLRRLPPGQWPPGAPFNGLNGLPMGPDGQPASEPPPGPWPSR